MIGDLSAFWRTDLFVLKKDFQSHRGFESFVCAVHDLFIVCK
jgi:hypothetical protein